MGWFGKLVGGGVGALIGGPAGAAIGFGLGSVYDKAVAGSGPGLDEGLLADARTTLLPDELGMQIVVRTATSLPDSSVCTMQFFSESEEPIRPNRHAGDRYTDGQGQLCVDAGVSGNVISTYLPAGAVPRGVTAKVLALVTLGVQKDDGSGVLLGQALFVMNAPEPQRWCQIELIEPLILLGMRVARADGKLLREEIRCIRDYMVQQFDLEPRDQGALRKAMKATKPWLTNHELLEVVHRRLPLVEFEHVLKLLAEVAQCDGVVSRSEVDVIRELALGYYGCSAGDWATVERALGIGVAEQPLQADHWAVLSISPGASRIEIKKAYHAKMLAYHPDKVANLAPEFQELAHRKTIEIRASYEALLRVVG